MSSYHERKGWGKCDAGAKQHFRIYRSSDNFTNYKVPQFIQNNAQNKCFVSRNIFMKKSEVNGQRG